MAAEVTKSLGGLVTMVERDETHTTMSLRCATHFKAWKIGYRVINAEWDSRDMRLRERWSAIIVREARSRLDSCPCASPLFDEDYTR